VELDRRGRVAGRQREERRLEKGRETFSEARCPFAIIAHTGEKISLRRGRRGRAYEMRWRGRYWGYISERRGYPPGELEAEKKTFPA